MEAITYYHCEELEIIHLQDHPMTYREHNHTSTHAVGLVMNGQITLIIDGRPTIYPAGSYFIIPPFQVHALVLPEFYDLISLCVNWNQLCSHERDGLHNVLRKMLRQIPTCVNDNLLDAAIAALYDSVANSQVNSVKLPDTSMIWNSLEQDCSLNVMANSTGYSVSHYIKRFKKDVGLTPHRYLLQSKIRQSQRLIENGSSIADTATLLGFYDQSHFIKCFRSIVGLTPIKYKDSVRQLQIG